MAPRFTVRVVRVTPDRVVRAVRLATSVDQRSKAKYVSRASAVEISIAQIRTLATR